jgi:GWxTD domain-containing protein
MNSPLVTALGATLFHFLWEGALIALLLAAFRAEPKLRYRLACTAMLAMPVVFFTTLFVVMPESYPRLPVTGSLPLVGAPSAVPTPHAPSFLEQLRESMRWFVPVWVLGIAVLFIRALFGWIATQRLRRAASAPNVWQTRLNELAARVGITQAVSLLESALIDVPMMTGFLRPVILIPAGLLTGLPTEQIEYLLLHELGHIRRFDYAMNLLQTAIEALLFYHPAVWWVSTTLRQEREYCCDEIVLGNGANRGLYAMTLHALEATRPGLAMAATGGSLKSRIRRILNSPAKPPASAAPLLGLFCIAAAFLVGQTPPQDYSRWLRDEVPYIIQNDERTTFQALQTNEERNRFIEQFWLRRKASAKAEHYRRLAYAASHFGAKTDRARIYITYGPPDEIDAHPATQLWLYRYITGIGENVKMEFTDKDGDGTFPMTTDPNGRPTPYDKWLADDVGYIIRPEERQAFNALTTDEEHNHFIEQFWRARGTGVKEEHYRRLSFALANFGVKTPRGGIYIRYGAPDEVLSSDAWFYRHLDAIGDNLTVDFTSGGVSFEIRAPRLVTDYDHWLNRDVIDIVRPEQRIAFTSLRTDVERNQFIDQFWRVRGGGKAKEEHYRRLSYAQQNFREQEIEGEKTDRGRTYIIYGPPDEIDARYADASAMVSWRYRSLNQTIKFRDEGRMGRYLSVSITKN